jgi:precorrin-3B synthase
MGGGTVHTGTSNAAHAERAGHATRTGTDRCPTTTTPHRASDGQIIRLRLPGGRLAPQAAQALAAAAMPGDAIELTARGNLQLRGLHDDAHATARRAIDAHGLLPSAAHDRARGILASPLIGRTAGAGLTDTFVRALDAAILARTDTTATSGRVLTVIDDGTGHTWAADADLLLRWDTAHEHVELRLAGGFVETATPAFAPTLAAQLLGRFATVATRYGAWRGHELAPAALASLGARPAPPLPPAAPLPIGTIEQADDLAAVRALAPFGRLSGAMLAGSATLAHEHNTELRIDHERGVTLVDLPPAAAPGALAALRDLGLLTSADHPAVGLTACAGRDCTRTEVDVRAALPLRHAARRPGDPREHLVGCDRRCGAPRHGHTIVADPTDTPQQLAARAAAALTRPTAEA